MRSLLYLLVALAAAGELQASLIPPPPGGQCVEPVPGQGLGTAIRKLIDQLPLERLLEIYMTAVSNDPDVMEAVMYLESPDFLHIITVMHDCPEFSEVLEFMCNETHFDAYYYLNSLGELFGFPTMKRPGGTRSSRSIESRTGFRGMMLDIGDAIPMDEIRQTYREQYENDQALRDAMAMIGSPTFRRIGDAIEALPEYVVLCDKLRDIGVDVDLVLETVMNFFGW